MTKRTRDAWGDPIKERPERNPWGRPKVESAKPKLDPWGHPVKPPQPKRLPECAVLFKPVEKIESSRTHDAWGHPTPERGMPSKEFARAVAEAQAVIFEKARTSRPTDENAAKYVDAMTALLREKATTDAALVEALQDCTTWSHTSPATYGPRPAPNRLQRRSESKPATLTPARRVVTETHNGRTNR